MLLVLVEMALGFWLETIGTTPLLCSRNFAAETCRKLGRASTNSVIKRNEQSLPFRGFFISEKVHTPTLPDTGRDAPHYRIAKRQGIGHFKRNRTGSSCLEVLAA